MFKCDIKGTKEDRAFKYSMARILGLTVGQACAVRDLSYNAYYKRLKVLGLIVCDI